VLDRTQLETRKQLAEGFASLEQPTRVQPLPVPRRDPERPEARMTRLAHPQLPPAAFRLILATIAVITLAIVILVISATATRRRAPALTVSPAGATVAQQLADLNRAISNARR
jgi:hypothetical protein